MVKDFQRWVFSFSQELLTEKHAKINLSLVFASSFAFFNIRLKYRFLYSLTYRVYKKRFCQLFHNNLHQPQICKEIIVFIVPETDKLNFCMSPMIPLS